MNALNPEGQNAARRRIITFAAVTLSVLLTGTAGAAAQALKAQATPVTAAKAAAAEDSQPEYRIGPGDTLKVFVWQSPELSETVPVLPDGRISTPLDEDMPAVGKTPAGLARDIEKRLSQYLKNPVVNVIVMHAQSQFSQVSVIGEVKSPHILPYADGLTVLQAVLDAGGPTEWAALKDAKIIRREGGKQKDIPVNLYALMQKGNLSEDYELKAGDVIVVPESRF